LRVNEPEIGTVLIRTEGDRDAVLAIDRTLVEHQSHWLVREIVLFMKRTLKRMDLTARTFFALIEPGSAFAGRCSSWRWRPIAPTCSTTTTKRT
jgi:benzoyl-CoA-dihydrodiol lyase